MEINLDSSVLIALANEDDVHHKSCSKIFNSRPHIYQASVMAYLEALYSGFKVNYERALAASLDLISRLDQIFDVDLEVATAALRLVSETGMELPDSVICATAEIYGEQLWTCDKGMVTKFPQAKYIGA